MASGPKGHPVIVYARLPAEDDHRYHYARWAGTRWDDHEITAGGKWFPQTPEGQKEGEPHYSGGVVLDPRDPSIVYLSRPVKGIFEIERWQTPDGGRNWSRTAVTSGSKHHNVRPVVARGDYGQNTRVLWMHLHGGYSHYTRFHTGIKVNLPR